MNRCSKDGDLRMPKIGNESPSASEKEVSRNSGGDGWLKTHWGVLSLCVIVIIALLLRTVFAYGISANNDFALSGGSGAQYHLHVVESILNGTYAIGADAAVNYLSVVSMYTRLCTISSRRELHPSLPHQQLWADSTP